MTIAVGDTLPAATLIRMGESGPEPVEVPAYFAGRRVVVFALPGAFTPTCSAKHLPGFIEKVDDFKAKGIDEIVCFSVNDVFVMDAWGKANDAAGKVTLLADGNGTFAAALGLTTDSSRFGMGIRAQRFAMLIDDGKVAQLFVEAPGEFMVSSADHMLSVL